MGQHKTRARTQHLTVSVCIPTIPGREHLLRRAVASVHAQQGIDFSRVRILVHRDEGRAGAAAARNALLKRCETDTIAWLDDDDWLRESHLKACLRVLESDPAVGLVYPRPVMDGGNDPTAVRYQGVFPVSPWGLRWQPELEAHLRHVGSFIPITHLVRTETVRRAGGFPQSRRLPDGRLQGEDERYLIALLDAGARFAHLDAKTWVWNARPSRGATMGLGRPAVPAPAWPKTDTTPLTAEELRERTQAIIDAAALPA